jgi:hypothetical protein
MNEDARSQVTQKTKMPVQIRSDRVDFAKMFYPEWGCLESSLIGFLVKGTSSTRAK